MSINDPTSWSVLKTTEYARDYKNPLHPVDHKRVIELDSGVEVTELRVKDCDQAEETVTCEIVFADGDSRTEKFLISNIRELLTKEKPALEINH